MITKKISVSYREQSREVVPTVSISYEGDAEGLPTNDEILQEQKALFVRAQQLTKNLTMLKAKPSK